MTGISLKQQGIPLPVDTLCEVSVFLKGAAPPIHVDMKGRVGRSTDEELAVEFKEVDLESLSILKTWFATTHTNPQMPLIKN